ncbi:MAG TPA: hypothetical protein VFS44_14530 [Gemmatimonadaceae bacterium]|nr:hypothetical protein [Gemmatimonadaceae bacterium]
MDTKGEKSRQERKPQQEEKHPPEWERDLDPHHMAGQNYGGTFEERERPIETAYELKGIHRALADMHDDELKQIPILREGTRLQQGATYIDLTEHPPHELKPNGGVEVERGHFYVPKDRVPYWIWNKLIGEEKT